MARIISFAFLPWQKGLGYYTRNSLSYFSQKNIVAPHTQAEARGGLSAPLLHSQGLEGLRSPEGRDVPRVAAGGGMRLGSQGCTEGSSQEQAHKHSTEAQRWPARGGHCNGKAAFQEQP
ncbi:hypothetical protein DV515_00010079 [Chloebia gouldiae]|uniref:Uncharacterized protein n=1 Tax=Chloebia gouldiae TaxID=44316 RepID=A0A3L8SAP9_CHLGU|nr:hypothetical protein DV515_00010079 [Chloebia gouldiae]